MAVIAATRSLPRTGRRTIRSDETERIAAALGGSWFVSAFEALTLKPPALPEDTYIAQNLITSEIDVIVQCRRTPQYGRRVTEIVEVRDGVLVPVFLFDEKTLQHKRFLFD